MKREQVKNTAVAMVREHGLINLSRRALCEKAGVPDGSFSYVMGCSFGDFVQELVAEGIEAPVTPARKARANPELRKQHILTVAIELAREVGYQNVRRQALAEAAGVSMGLVTRYFGTMNQLRRDIMRRAVSTGEASVVAQGLVNHDAHALKAPEALKEKARAALSTSF